MFLGHLGALLSLRIGPPSRSILEMLLFSLFESCKAPPMSILSKWLVPTLKVLILGGIGRSLKFPGLTNIPGILQARTLEWVAVSFSNA